jgi:hypothetical protein
MVGVEWEAEDWTIVESWIGMVTVEIINVNEKNNLKIVGRTINLKIVRLN